MIRAHWFLAFAAAVGLPFAAGLVGTTIVLGAPAGNAQPAERTIVGAPADGTPGLAYEDIVAKVKAAGFGTVHSIDFEHGRYEVKAHDPKSKRWFEVFVDPKTAELVLDPQTGKPRRHPVGRSTIAGAPIPVQEIVAAVTAEGFRHVYSVEREHSLFEIKAIDPEGRKVELFMNPKTGKLLRSAKTGKPMVEILSQ